MEVFKETLGSAKVILYIDRNNIIYRLLIENFDPIITFDDSEIKFKRYIIKGNYLKIRKMEEDELEILGEIEGFYLDK